MNCHLRAIPVLKLQLLVFLTAFSHVLVDPVESIRHVIVVLSHARSITDRVGDDSAVRLNKIDLSKRPEVLARTSSKLSSIEHSYLRRIVALADLLDLVCWRVLLRDEVRHADDFVLFVIFDYIGLLDYWHKVFSMADLALQSTPDLSEIYCQSMPLSYYASDKAVNREARPKSYLPDHEKEQDQSPQG